MFPRRGKKRTVFDVAPLLLHFIAQIGLNFSFFFLQLCSVVCTCRIVRTFRVGDCISIIIPRRKTRILFAEKINFARLVCDFNSYRLTRCKSFTRVCVCVWAYIITIPRKSRVFRDSFRRFFLLF